MHSRLVGGEVTLRTIPTEYSLTRQRIEARVGEAGAQPTRNGLLGHSIKELTEREAQSHQSAIVTLGHEIGGCRNRDIRVPIHCPCLNSVPCTGLQVFYQGSYGAMYLLKDTNLTELFLEVLRE